MIWKTTWHQKDITLPPAFLFHIFSSIVIKTLFWNFDHERDFIFWKILCKTVLKQHVVQILFQKWKVWHISSYLLPICTNNTTYLVICSGIKENIRWNNIRWKINFVFQTSRNLKIAHSKYLIFYETEMLVIFCVGFLHAPYPTVRLSSLNIVTL